MDSEDFTTVYKWLSSKLSKRISEEAYNAGMTARDKADYDTAIKQFKKCIEADSGNVDAIYYLAWSYKKQKAIQRMPISTSKRYTITSLIHHTMTQQRASLT